MYYIEGTKNRPVYMLLIQQHMESFLPDPADYI